MLPVEVRHSPNGLLWVSSRHYFDPQDDMPFFGHYNREASQVRAGKILRPKVRVVLGIGELHERQGGGAAVIGGTSIREWWRPAGN